MLNATEQINGNPASLITIQHDLNWMGRTSMLPVENVIKQKWWRIKWSFNTEWNTLNVSIAIYKAQKEDDRDFITPIKSFNSAKP